MSKNYWNDEYWKNHLKTNEGEKLDFLDDLWIIKYEDIINRITKGKALDLGCGLGQYTKYLFDKGFDVISADISIEALNKVKENINEANIVQLDMSQPLKFDNDTFELVFANLSIHYFDENTTKSLVKEIKRIVKNNGYFIGTVNSSKGYEFIKDHAIKLDENYYFSNGRNIRLWNKEQFDYFFEEFTLIKLEEEKTSRWNRPKDMWKFVFQIKK